MKTTGIIICLAIWLASMGYAAWLIWFDVRDILAARRLDES